MDKFIHRLFFLVVVNWNETWSVRPCTWRSGETRIDGINACGHTYATGHTVLIDFLPATWSLATSCTCKIMVIDSGFVTFAVLNAPQDKDCNSLVTLKSSDRENTSKYRCGQVHPTRVASVNDPEVFTLSISKISTENHDVQSEFCFKIHGPLVELFVQCSPDFPTVTPDPTVTATELTVTTTDLTVTSPTVTDITEAPTLHLFIAIPTTVAGATFIFITILAVVCIIKRNKTKHRSDYPTPSHILSSSSNSQHLGILSKGLSDTLRSYEQPVSNGYLTMVDTQSNGNVSSPTADMPHIARYANVSQQNHNHGNNCQSRSEYETSGHWEDYENVYDVIQNVVYANVSDSETNQREDENIDIHYTKVIDG